MVAFEKEVQYCITEMTQLNIQTFEQIKQAFTTIGPLNVTEQEVKQKEHLCHKGVDGLL